MKNEFGKDRFKDVKAADALGRLSERSRSSRIVFVVVVVIGFFALAFAVGFLITSVGNGGNTPEIPTVEL